MKNRTYRWDDLPAEVVRRGVSRKGFRGESVMLVMNECQPGMEARPHTHTFEQIATFWQGQAIYHVGDQAHRVGPGSMLVIPEGVVHWIEVVGDEPVLNMDVFAPPREDYLHLVRYQEED